MEGSTKLYRIYKTITKMLDDRGYLLSQKELNRTVEQVRATLDSTAPDSPPQSSSRAIPRLGFFCGAHAETERWADTCAVQFKDEFGEDPTRARLGLLVPKKDDPTEKVSGSHPIEHHPQSLRRGCGLSR
jgi:hypothetical protein